MSYFFYIRAMTPVTEYMTHAMRSKDITLLPKCHIFAKHGRPKCLNCFMLKGQNVTIFIDLSSCCLLIKNDKIILLM